MKPSELPDELKALAARQDLSAPERKLELRESIARIHEWDWETAKAKAEEVEQRERKHVAARLISNLHNSCPKLAAATLKSYDIDYEDQQPVLARLTKICKSIDTFVTDRHQLFLWGTVGTGKDHLAFAVMRQAARIGYTALWIEGLEFYEQVAGAYNANGTQEAIYNRWAHPTVLLLSDPVFKTNFSPAKQEALRKLIRRRYDAGKATWVTCNVGSLEQAAELFSEDTFDRLSENAVRIECRWNSYRSNTKSEF